MEFKMKMTHLMAALATTITLTSAHAQDAGNEACAALLCMSGPDSAAPHECKPFVEKYFEIRVYKKGTFSTAFDPARTAAKRYETILEQCGDARQIDRDRVHAKFGHLQYSPFAFN